MTEDKLKSMFEKGFEEYWYKKKSLSQRIVDSLEDEEKICALFFETLNDLELLK